MGKESAQEYSLQWDRDHLGIEHYTLYTIIRETGQYRLESTFEKGPFDTTLEVAQWAWRAIARLLPPST